MRRFYIFIIQNAASRLQTVIITHTYFQCNLLPPMARNHYYFSLVHFRDGLCKVIFSQMKRARWTFCAIPTVKFPQLFALDIIISWQGNFYLSWFRCVVIFPQFLSLCGEEYSMFSDNHLLNHSYKYFIFCKEKLKACCMELIHILRFCQECF